MRKMVVVLAALAALMLAVVPSFAQQPTIAEIVVASATAETPEFSTLLAAVSAADPAVLEALSNADAQLTVFAPTDAAFAALAEALGEEAFGAVLADPAALTNILLYHVLDGVVMSTDVVAGLEANDGAFSVRTLQGQALDIAMTEMGGITIDKANLNLGMVDIAAANGVIHVIDAVVLPETRTIAEIVVASAAAETPEFSLLLAAVGAADPAVLAALSDPEAELTVFAPTDAAFTALGEETLNAVLADQALLTSILLYHVVGGVAYAADVVGMADMGTATVTTLQGSDITITVSDMGVMVNQANVIMTDVEAANGVIHVIDAVILPPSG
jgi:transforming growth factor-beta-induced protein